MGDGVERVADAGRRPSTRPSRWARLRASPPVRTPDSAATRAPRYSGRAAASKHEPRARALGHLPAVPGEAEAGDVGAGVHGVGPSAHQRLRRRPVQRPHPHDRLGLVLVDPPASTMPVPSGFDSTSDVAGPGPALGQHPVGVDEALHGEAEDRLLRADRVPAGDDAAGLGDDGGRGREDRPRSPPPAASRGRRRRSGRARPGRPWRTRRSRRWRRRWPRSRRGRRRAAGRSRSSTRGRRRRTCASTAASSNGARPDQQRPARRRPARGRGRDSGAAPHLAAHPPHAVHSVSRDVVGTGHRRRGLYELVVDVPTMRPRGTRVEVRSTFDGSWVERLRGRRHRRGRQRPPPPAVRRRGAAGAFAPDDVRRERRRQTWWV